MEQTNRFITFIVGKQHSQWESRPKNKNKTKNSKQQIRNEMDCDYINPENGSSNQNYQTQ